MSGILTGFLIYFVSQDPVKRSPEDIRDLRTAVATLERSLDSSFEDLITSGGIPLTIREAKVRKADQPKEVVSSAQSSKAEAEDQPTTKAVKTSDAPEMDPLTASTMVMSYLKQGELNFRDNPEQQDLAHSFIELQSVIEKFQAEKEERRAEEARLAREAEPPPPPPAAPPPPPLAHKPLSDKLVIPTRSPSIPIIGSKGDAPITVGDSPDMRVNQRGAGAGKNLQGHGITIEDLSRGRLRKVDPAKDKRRAPLKTASLADFIATSPLLKAAAHANSDDLDKEDVSGDDKHYSTSAPAAFEITHEADDFIDLSRSDPETKRTSVVGTDPGNGSASLQMFAIDEIDEIDAPESAEDDEWDI